MNINSIHDNLISVTVRFRPEGKNDTSPTFDGLATITGGAWVKSGLSGSLNRYYLQV